MIVYPGLTHVQEMPKFVLRSNVPSSSDKSLLRQRYQVERKDPLGVAETSSEGM